MPIEFQDIRPGEALPPWVAPSGLAAWNRFAAVNDEFVPVHMDDDAGRRAGNDAGAFGMGNLRLSYLANLLRDWAGDDAEIRTLHVEYRSRHQKDDVLTATGTVAAVTRAGDEGLVIVDVDVVAQDGRSTAPGTAVVVFPVAAATPGAR
jgi:acyl dehydratase